MMSPSSIGNNTGLSGLLKSRKGYTVQGFKSYGRAIKCVCVCVCMLLGVEPRILYTLTKCSTMTYTSSFYFLCLEQVSH